MNLSRPHRQLLCRLADGWTLKAHRDVEGAKAFRLHSIDGSADTVDPAIVDSLVALRLIDSNKKFPAATFWLTEQGKDLVTVLRESL